MFFLLEIAPIKKGITLDTVSYLSTQYVEEGSLIDINFRNRKAKGIVFSCSSALTEKEFIKKSGLKIKMLKNPTHSPFFTSQHIKTIKKISRVFATPIPKLLYEFMPQALLDMENLFLIPDNKTKKPFSPIFKAFKSKDAGKYTIQQTKQERWESYRTIIREMLAQDRSVFILTPTIHSAENVFNFCSKGIKEQSFLLHSKITKAQIKSRLKQALTSKKPVLIVATKGFSLLPRHDFGTYIIEEDSNFAYKANNTFTSADPRILLLEHADNTKSSIVFGDVMLSLYTRKLEIASKAEAVYDSIKTLRNTSRTQIIDLSAKLKTARKIKKTDYDFLSQQALSILKLKQRHLVLVSRKGIASTVVCLDCGNPMVCNKCGSIFSLFGKESERFFICKRCGEKKNANTLCPYCSSWNLKAYGVGIQQVEQRLKSEFPSKKIFTFSSTSKSKDTKILQEFYSTKDSILIVTPRFLNMLSNKHTFDNSIIVSIDQMLSAPTFRAEEQTFKVATLLKEHTKNKILIQTRMPQHHMFPFIKESRISKYLDFELELRRKLKYPPYRYFVTITISGSKSNVIKQTSKIMELIQDYKPRAFQDLVPLSPKIHYVSLIIRVKEVDEKLSEILKSLHNIYHIDVEI